MSVLNRLVGRRINGIFLNDDNTVVVFRTIEDEHIGFYTHGDCCNTVYINHFQGQDVIGDGNTFDLLRGALVTAVEEKEWVSIDDDEQDEDSRIVVETTQEQQQQQQQRMTKTATNNDNNKR